MWCQIWVFQVLLHSGIGEYEEKYCFWNFLTIESFFPFQKSTVFSHVSENIG